MSKETTTPIPLVREADAAATQDQLAPVETEAARANGNARADEYPVVDFLEPILYEWTEAAYEVRQVLKRYNEETHGDY